ncbi:MAG: Hpt domain-containing protein [Arcobacteraceae bacterium]|nr:Hpt domain-containing protein [Arcobacteraceae bacterium]
MSYNIDLQKISDELDFDLEDVEMLIEVFLDGANESLSSLKIAIDENNLEQIFKLAHAIKGSSANLLLNNISNIAKEMEHEAREGNEINYLEKFEILKKMISNI